MRTFALYKLPYAKEITEILVSDDNDVEEIYSYANLSEKQGFVIAPFALSNDCPIVLIRPNTIRHYDLDDFLKGKLINQGIFVKEKPINAENLPNEIQQARHYYEESKRYDNTNFQCGYFLEQVISKEEISSNRKELHLNEQQDKKNIKVEVPHSESKNPAMMHCSILRTSDKKLIDNNNSMDLSEESILHTSVKEQTDNNKLADLRNCSILHTSAKEQAGNNKLRDLQNRSILHTSAKEQADNNKLTDLQNRSMLQSSAKEQADNNKLADLQNRSMLQSSAKEQADNNKLADLQNRSMLQSSAKEQANNNELADLQNRSMLQSSAKEQANDNKFSDLGNGSKLQSSVKEQANNNELADLENCSMLQSSAKEQADKEITDGSHAEDKLILEEDNRKNYAIDFANFHAQICSDEFAKLVLARKATYKTHKPISPLTLFARACRNYPRMFVALVSSARSGIWLTATPEILLEGHENQWRTMALAGTMKLEGEQMSFDTPPTPNSKIANADLIWSLKNRAEQRIVATYVTQCLEQFTSNFSEDGPFSTRAGNLVHLRSDFKFSLNSEQSVGQLIEALHPTPAVCGLPKREACQFILENEVSPRRYYSGFMGPLGLNGDTHLFVTLRCMEINSNRYNLYAGGGLLKESEEEKEWQETEMKMETMKQCLQTRKI